MAKRPGKYDAVLRKLPKFKEPTTPYQERVERAKLELRVCPSCNGDRANAGGATCERCAGSGRIKLTAPKMAEKYIELRKQKDVAERVLADITRDLEACSQMLIESQENGDAGWGAFGAADNAITLLSGDSIRTQPEVYPFVVDKNLFRDWCVCIDLAPDVAHRISNGELSKLFTLPPKELSDMVKDRLLEGKPEPKGVTVFAKTKIVYTEAKLAKTAAEEQAASETL